jgi:hypothetical protein
MFGSPQSARGHKLGQRHGASSGCRSLQVEEAFSDDSKRIIGIRMRGVKKTINIMCGYFEKVTLPKEEHTKFYNFLLRGVPKCNDPNQLYIETGDKNCALDPPNQRIPYRNDHVEANQSLLNFIQTHNLI